MATIQRDINSFTATIERNGNTYNVTVERTTTPIEVTITRKSGEDGAQGPQGLPGEDGREVEFQKSATHIQWRYVGEIAWTNLIALTEITGPQGATGAIGATGNGIASIVRTSGTGAAGTTDTYTITYTNGGTATFTVYNGADGSNGTNGTNGTNGLNADMTRTSTTSNTIGTGSKSFTFSASSSNLGWLVGTRLRATATAGNFMSGVITSVSTTDVTITVDYTSGSGTFSSWNISIAGEVGATGATGATGPNQVTNSTDTNITGPLFGNGSKVYLPTAQQAQPYVIPSLTTAQRDALGTPATGYTIFNNTEGYLEYYDSFWGWMPVAGQNEWKRKWGYEYWNDFLYGNNGASSGDVFQITGNAVVSVSPASGESAIGIVGVSTGTSASGAGQVRSDFVNGPILFSNGRLIWESRVRFPNLSTGTQRYYCRLGIGDVSSWGAVAFGDGVYFLYDEGGVSTGSSASANWQIVCGNASTRSFTTTSVAVASNTFQTLRFEVNSNQTSITFYINGVSVGTLTNNIPTNGACSINNTIIKTIGTTARLLQTDYIGVKQKFNSAR